MIMVVEKEGIWTEKYRPRKLDEVVGQKPIIENLKAYVRSRTLPHLIFAGPSGVGKTAAAIAMANELFGDIRENFIELNASVAPETPVTIKENGELRRTNFDELARCNFDADEKYAEVKGLEILSFDFDDHVVKFMPVSSISRHRVERIAEIKYEGGRIRTSLGHSVIVFSNGRLIPKRVSELNTGDSFVTFQQIGERIPEKGLHSVLVESSRVMRYDGYVYDVSVPGTEVFFGGTIPVLLHNSDERGIDTVRKNIKNFARKMPSGDARFKIIFLDEADALTKDAQSALRRTME